MMYLENDQFIGGSLEAYGESHVNELSLYFDLITKNDIVVDVGTNIGTISIPLAKKARSVISFEPQTFLYYIFCGNIALNGLRNIRPMNRAVGSKRSTAYVVDLDYGVSQSFGSVPVSKTSHNLSEYKIPQIALDSVNFDGKVKFLKIDVEGLELQVLKGAKKLIKNSRPFVSLEFKEDKDEILKFFRDMNYEILGYMPPYYNPDNVEKNSVKIYNFRMINIFCYPRESTIPSNKWLSSSFPRVKDS